MAGNPMTRFSLRSLALVTLLFLGFRPVRAQSPEGPMTPQPGAPVQQPPKNPSTKLLVRVTLVNTPVTVRDAKGQMVHDLEAKDFRVTDNNIEQKIAYFDLGGEPLSLVVLIETSSRIEPMLSEIRKSGVVVTQQVMGAEGEVAVVSFNDSVDKLQSFTSNTDLVENVFAHLNAGTSGMKLYDAMAASVEMLSSRPQGTGDAPGRRRVLLVISEAQDEGSTVTLGDVLRRAQLENVTIYSVGLSSTRADLQAPPKDTRPRITPPGISPQPPMPGTVNTPDNDAARYGSGDLLALAVWAVKNVKNKITANPLEVAAAATGGVHMATFKDRSIESAIDEIGGELHSQYTLTYAPAGTSAYGYHEIKISLVDSHNKKLKVRARPGYYLAEPES